jgi:hypothetical protein
MLHFETIDTRTFELLVKLQATDVFSNLRLVDGTSLALQIGHRRSVDLDLSGIISADEFDVSNQLTKIGQFTILKRSQNISVYVIEGIKVDIVNYHYKWLDGAVIENSITLAGIKDIAAMKLAAITGRGTKKDFVDLYYLLEKYSLEEMLGFYAEKYNEASEFLVLKSLSYFSDADTDENPMMLKPCSWDIMKTTIKNELDSYIRNKSKI